MNKQAILAFFTKIKMHAPALCLSALSAWLCTLIIFAYAADTTFSVVPDFTQSISLPFFIAVFFGLAAAFFLLSLFTTKKLLPVALLTSFGVYGAYSVAKYIGNMNEKAYAALVFALLALALIVICANFMRSQGISLTARDIGAQLSFAIVAVGFVGFSALFIYFLGSRTAALCSPCFDMGIFAQMYDRMTETFLPITTCERGFELSHFAVHFSPILYLLLPFCFIFEATDVLVWAQILLVFSGAFPLWLICRRVGLSNIRSAVVSLLFFLYPAMSSGAFYDFHENAFLTPLILWTLYFVHAEKIIPTFVFALGVLMVKEDAAIYVVFIALYIFFSRKKYWQGIAMFVLAFAYFLFASYMLMKGGQGMMLGSRYYNIIGYDGSFFDLIRTAIVNPALYAAESFTSSKLLYTINMLLPFALLPLVTRKPSRWLLIAPLFVINLISDYQYQYDLGFQYSFGSGALLAYLAAINLADLSPITAPDTNGAPTAEESKKSTFCVRKFSAAMLVFALFCSVFLMSARITNQGHYVDLYKDEKQNIKIAKQELAKIDRSKSIAATSMYLTELYDADRLYHLSDNTGQVLDENEQIKLYTDIVIVDLRPYISDSDDAVFWKRKYLNSGYTIVKEIEDVILILEKGELPAKE